MPRLLAVCAVHALRPDAGAVGVTAIDKRAVDGAVKIGRLGVYADVQASRKHHGGPDKAVYAYGQDDAEYWQRELGRDLPPGWFGENLRVSGFDVNASRIGDIWRIGSRVELEVTMPRTPCQTFARWVGGADARGWVKRFSAARRLGPYLRVRATGSIRAGDEITIEPAPAGAPGLLDAYRDPVD